MILIAVAVRNVSVFHFHRHFLLLLLLLIVFDYLILNWFRVSEWRNGKWQNAACLSLINNPKCRYISNDNEWRMMLMLRCWRERKKWKENVVALDYFSSVEIWFLPFLVMLLEFVCGLQHFKSSTIDAHAQLPFQFAFHIEAEQCLQNWSTKYLTTLLDPHSTSPFCF